MVELIVRPDAETGSTTAKQEKYEKKMAKYAANKARKEQKENERKEKMNTDYVNPDAATGTTTAVKYVGKTNVAGTQCTNFEYPAETSIDVIIGLTDVCIEAAKMGKPTFAYTNMYLEDRVVGVSVSFHNVCGEVIYIVAFSKDNNLEEEFRQDCTRIVGDYMRKRGLFRNKSFNKKVMKTNPDTLVREVDYFTTHMYENTKSEYAA